ncbi:helix-turn-helix domain-containing protein [Novosphingobium sp. SL115]|uniref:helix-turn-helix domain-containing protein n=1 Tax=Novosphingobium sp. SL115 TaxID=2995150 RepID=UPI0022756569|nr:helix-turn-helix domain-containing protein [Novosphingobium sp. SL115]MCY1670870.1 helix-turn-helix domain-containing protein [Novosphingobium sp. SL115]
MATLLKYHTRDVAPPDRVRYWNEIADRVFTGTFVQVPGEDFAGRMLSWRVGELDMIRTDSTQSAVGRTPMAQDDERLILHLQCRGSSEHEQRQAECALQPGDFVLASPHTPYSIKLTGHEMLVVEFPRAPLAERFPCVDDALMQRMCGATPGGRVFHDFLLSLWQQGERAAEDPEWEVGVNAVFYDMVALAMRGSQRPSAQIGEVDLRRRVLAMVSAHLDDPALRTASIADACSISVRTVQNVFATMGTTPTAWILDQRLRRAADRLVARPDASITEIAFALGFNDSAYFTRCFRQQFGVAPRDWRLGRSGAEQE